MIPRIINKQYIAGTPHLSLINLTYLDKYGQEKNWISAERPGNKNAVVIVALNYPTIDNPLLVIIKEFRVPICGYEWGLPAGLIEPGLSIEENAAKELKEETGLSIQRFLKPTTPFVYNSPGMSNEAVSYVFVEAVGEPFKSQPDKDPEDITTFLFSRATVAQLMHDAMDPSNKIMIGSKAWLIFERFVKYGDV